MPSTARSSRLVAALILIVRPILHLLNEIVSNQILVPQTTNMVRWRTHLYTLGHIRSSYFQGDFAGRLANRITQGGPAIRELAVTVLDTLLYVAIFAVTALGLFAQRSACGSRCRWRCGSPPTSR